MGRLTVDEVLLRHRRVAFDSNVLIYALEGQGKESRLARSFLDAIAAGAGEGVLSLIAVAEVLVQPAAAGDPALVERYADELLALERFVFPGLDRSIAVESALIRATARLSLPDAIQVAAARVGGAGALVTNDRDIRSVSGVEVVYLSDLEA